MIEEVRRTLFAVAYYFAGIAVALCALAIFTLTTIRTLPTFLPTEERQKSTMAIQFETAREVKAALSRPIAQPELLPPITAKLANPAPSKIASEDQAKAHDKRRISQMAREAFGMDPSLVQPQPATEYYPAVDRFKPL